MIADFEVLTADELSSLRSEVTAAVLMKKISGQEMCLRIDCGDYTRPVITKSGKHADHTHR